MSPQYTLIKKRKRNIPKQREPFSSASENQARDFCMNAKIYAIYTYTKIPWDRQNNSFKNKPCLGEMGNSGSWIRDKENRTKMILGSHVKRMKKAFEEVLLAKKRII